MEKIYLIAWQYSRWQFGHWGSRCEHWRLILNILHDNHYLHARYIATILTRLSISILRA